MFYAAGFAFFRRENEAQKETPAPAAIMTALSSSYFFIQRTRRAPDEIECARIAVAKVCRPQEMETPRFSPQQPIQSNFDTGSSRNTSKSVRKGCNFFKSNFIFKL